MPGVWAGSSRALPDIKTRVVVDSSQLQRAHTNATAFGSKTKAAMKDAKSATLDTERAMGQLESRMGRVGGAAGSLSGMFTGGLTPATAGLGLALAAVVVGGKSMVDISEKQESAERNLKQAVDEHNASLKLEGRVVTDTSKQQGALVVAQNGLKVSQMAYTDAVRKHGAHSQQATAAALRLQDAQLRVRGAQESLTTAQAKNTAGTQRQAINYDELRGKADQFIQSNRAYISDQADVVEGYGKLVRSGLTVTETQRVMNDAVDLAALKHISLTQAVDVLNAAEHGRMRGLIDLGITTKQLTDENGNLLKGTAAVGDAMHEVDAKVKGGRDTLTDYEQHVNQLSNDWQDLSRKGGPVIMTLLDTVVKGLEGAYDWFDRIGKDNGLWAGISGRLTAVASWIHDYFIVPIATAYNWLAKIAGWQQITGDPTMYSGEIAARNAATAAGQARSSSFGKGGKAGGGLVVPGGVYTVGEAGPETLVMGAGGAGGTVIPNSGGGGGAPTINVYVSSTSDPYDIANEVGWELRKLRRFA